jgi:hypothetical protein
MIAFDLVIRNGTVIMGAGPGSATRLEPMSQT